MRAAEQALAIYTKHGPHTSIAQARFTIGKIYHGRDNYEAAEALNTRRALSDRAGFEPACRIHESQADREPAAACSAKGQPEKELEMVLSVIPMLERIRYTGAGSGQLQHRRKILQRGAI